MVLMHCFPVFLSVVLVTRNQAGHLRATLERTVAAVSELAADFEIIVIDNASDDDGIALLKDLAGEQGLPNLQVYALTKEVDVDTASWVGLENALGDFVAVVDPMTDDVAYLRDMLDRAAGGVDVVFATNEQRPPSSLGYRLGYSVFNLLYRWFNGIHLARDAPQFRILSRRVVNFILQHARPEVAYRHLPATGGFSRANLAYSARLGLPQKKRLRDSFDRGMRLLVSTTQGPMRVVTSLTLFGALSNVVYSIYVIAVGIFKHDVAPGWVTLSLQQSGMFFLISLVLLVLGEYILNMATLSNEGPRYHVAQEFSSALMTRRDRLNIDLGQPVRTPLVAGMGREDRA